MLILFLLLLFVANFNEATTTNLNFIDFIEDFGDFGMCHNDNHFCGKRSIDYLETIYLAVRFRDELSPTTKPPPTLASLIPTNFADVITGIKFSVFFGEKVLNKSLTRDEVGDFGGFIINQFLNTIPSETGAPSGCELDYYYQLMDITALSARIVVDTFATIYKVDVKSNHGNDADTLARNFIDFLRLSLHPDENDCKKTSRTDKIRTTFLMEMVDRCVETSRSKHDGFSTKAYTVREKIEDNIQGIIDEAIDSKSYNENNYDLTPQTKLTIEELFDVTISAGAKYYLDMIIYVVQSEKDDSRKSSALLAHRLYYISFLKLASKTLQNSQFTATEKEKQAIKFIIPMSSGLHFTTNLMAFLNQKTSQHKDNTVGSFVMFLQDIFDVYEMIVAPSTKESQILLGSAKASQYTSEKDYTTKEKTSLLSIPKMVFKVLLSKNHFV